jgi:YfiH family protein
MHGVTQRTGGVSEVPGLSSLNLSFRVHDDESAVRENRRRTAQALGFEASAMVCAEQVHGAAVAIVGQNERRRGAMSYNDAMPGVDALVTTEPNVLLTLFFADCYPVVLADRQRRVVGVAHAGWRGAVAGVVENTVTAMVVAANIRPDDLVAAIGPGIGACCFEVGDEVAAHFGGFTVPSPNVGGRPHVNLRAAIRARLLATGIAPENIEVCPHCTSCEPERYFSHRRDQGRTGRMAALIGLTAD